MKRSVVLIAIGAAACASAESQPINTAPAPDTLAMLQSMARLVGITPAPAQLDGWVAAITKDRGALDGVIDELVASGRLSGEILPALIFGSFASVRSYYAVPSGYVLQQASPDEPFYLRSPCADGDAIAVRPWWDPRSEVRVCPEAYRPETWMVGAGQHAFDEAAVIACDSQIGSPEAETRSICGCGPNLIRCMRDREQYDELNASLMDELRQTTAWIVEHDLPMSTLFTSNQTFRDRNVELYYQRQRIGAQNRTDLGALRATIDGWPEQGRWAPRVEVVPGQHAGVLTAPQLLHSLPDRRQRQRAYYEVMWCTLQNAFGATTQRVLELNSAGNNFFTHDSWKQLAHAELCTNCHARLDYGFQFFLGYPDSRASVHYIPSLVPPAPASGPTYGETIDDPRGTAPLTPTGFAQMATAQPEFASCMTHQIASYVLGEGATSEDVRSIQDAVTGARTFKAAVKTALYRFAARFERPLPRPKPLPVPSPVPPYIGFGALTPAAPVAVKPSLRALLDRTCVDCHDANGARTMSGDLDLSLERVPRATMVRMTELVAFGTMPKDQVLDAAVRDVLVVELIESLWSDEAARAEARRYYLGRQRGVEAQQFDNALFYVRSAAGSSADLEWGAIERGIAPHQTTITPGMIAVTAFEALRACQRATRATESLERCLLDATAIPLLAR